MKHELSTEPTNHPLAFCLHKMQMQPEEQAFLTQILQGRKRYLEIGAGFSTLWFSQYSDRMVSVEARKDWFDQVSCLLDAHHVKNVELKWLPPEPCAFDETGLETWTRKGRMDDGRTEEFVSYLKGIADLLEQESFDVVLVDGNVRQQVVEMLIQTQFDGVVLLHDVEPARRRLNDPILSLDGVKVVRQVGTWVELAVAPYKVEVGGSRYVPGWLTFTKDKLDVTAASDWQRHFKAGGIRTIFAEHVLEHLNTENVRAFFDAAHHYLCDNGTIRLAVPDAAHPSQYYRDLCRPGGTDVGSDDHHHFFAHHNIAQFFPADQYDIKLLEWWDEDGFHRSDWRNDAVCGKVQRSSRYYNGRITQSDDLKRLLYDTTPETLRAEYDKHNITYTSFIFELIKKPTVRIQPKSEKTDHRRCDALNKIIGFCISRRDSSPAFRFRRHFPWLRFEKHQIGDWFVTLWGHGSFAPFIRSCGGARIVVGYTQQELELLGTERLENRGVFVDIQGKAIRLTSDAVGAFRVFYGAGEGNVCFSSHEESVLECAGTRSLDKTNVIQYLLTGHLTGEQTLYPHIFTMQANTVLRYDGAAFSSEALPPLSFVSSQNPVDDLWRVTEATIRKYARDYAKMFLPLSGGYDSRLIAACVEGPERISAATYDYSYPVENGYEATRAGAIARAAGIRDWRPFDLGADYAADFTPPWLDIFGSSHHQHGMYVLHFYRQMLKSQGGSIPILSGYIGDLFAGHQLGVFAKYRHCDEAEQFYQSQYRGAMGFSTDELRWLFNGEIESHLAVIKERWSRAWSACEGQDYHRFILSLARHRGRNHVSYLCTLSDLYGAAITPFIDRRYIETILGLPCDLLLNRAAQQTMIKTYLPAFWLDESKMPPYRHVVNHLCMQKRKLENIAPMLRAGRPVDVPYLRREAVEALVEKFSRLCDSPTVLSGAGPIQPFYQLNTLLPIYYAEQREGGDVSEKQGVTVNDAAPVSIGRTPQKGHYDQGYFDWQKSIGRFGGMANRFKFQDCIRPTDTVLDFGCGGGYLLSGLDCRRKIGVEINTAAHQEARANGVEVYATIDDVDDGSVDVIISNHALEHVLSPGQTLTDLRQKLKPGGRVVFVVPHEDMSKGFDPNDHNKHLFTWTPQTLGNLFEQCGYAVETVEAIQHQWPPQFEAVYEQYGEEAFHRICREYARANQNYQIRIVAAAGVSSTAGRCDDVPVVLMTYNRPAHTAQVLESLRAHRVRNLYIFSDAPKTPEHRQAVEQTRALIASVDWTTPTVVCQETNQGLAKSIVSAVNRVFETHHRLILLEDDCVPQRYFFDYMHDCLDKYEHNPKIYGISGYSVEMPEAVLKDYPYDVYFSPRIGSWGWATWKRAWTFHNPDLDALIKTAVSNDIDLTQGGTDMPVVLEKYLQGRLRDVWTLHWVLSVYNQGGCYVYPTQSHIKNVGIDGTGSHCSATTRYDSPCADHKPKRYPNRVVYDERILEHFRSYFQTPAEMTQKSIAFLRNIATVKPLNVLQFSLADNKGGAARVAWTLKREMTTRGHTSRMLVRDKLSDDPDVQVVRDERIDGQTAKRRQGFPDYDIQSTFQVPSRPAYQDADIVHFHNLHSRYFNINALPELTRHKPCVWTLHDMHALTGHCAHAMDCGKWQTGCGHCPDLKTYPSLSVDTTAQLWADKKKLYAQSRLHIVVPSMWLMNIVRNSVLKDKPVHLIYNGVDTQLFRPHPRDAVRRQLGIDPSRKVLLFTGMYGIDSVWRDGTVIQEMMDYFARKDDSVVFLNVGQTENRPNTPNTIHVGHVADEHTQALLYSAADALLCPTLADNCPLVVLEAMACGLPVVAYRTGGVPELVEDKKTGLVCETKNRRQFIQAAEIILTNENVRKVFSVASRQRAERLFSSAVMAGKYLALYQDVIKQFHRPDTKKSVPAASLSDQNYLVSAVVSTYNAEAFIQGCLDDLIDQTLYKQGRLEIVVVNSGSEQNEEAIVRAYMQRHPHIRYMRTDARETIYAAWNRGIKAASGKYITNANTDDRHSPEMFETLATVLDNDPDTAYVYSRFYITDTPHQTWHTKTPRCIWERTQPYDRRVLLEKYYCGPQPMWRRSLHDEYGYFDGRLKVYGDYEFALRISQTHHLKMIPDVLGLYWQNPNSLERSTPNKQQEKDAVLDLYRRHQGRIIRRPFTEAAFRVDKCLFTNGRSTAPYAMRSIGEAGVKPDEVIVIANMPNVKARQYCLDHVKTTFFFQFDDDFLVHPKAIDYMESRLRAMDDRAAVGLYFCHLWDDANGIIECIKIYNADAIKALGGFSMDALGREDRPTNAKLREAGFRIIKDMSVVAVHAIGGHEDIERYEALWKAQSADPSRPRKEGDRLEKTLEYAKRGRSLEAQYAMRLDFVEEINRRLDTPFHRYLNETGFGDTDGARRPSSDDSQRRIAADISTTEKASSVQHPLRIAHINTLAHCGGAAKSTRRLADVQRRWGHTAELLVSQPFQPCEHIHLFDPAAPPELLRRCQQSGQLYYAYQGSHRLFDNAHIRSADIVHCSNLHSDYFNPWSLSALSHHKPVVWTLRDMQAITGHCAHSLTCDKWQTGCGQCPDLSIYPSLQTDTTAQLWRDKRYIYQHSHLQIVAPSDWLRRKLQQSILRDHPIELIYNGCDINTFKPSDKRAIRRQLGIADDVFVVGAVSQSGVLNNPWKGGRYTQAAWRAIRQLIPNSLFVNIGANVSSNDRSILDIPAVQDEAALAKLYNALDVFLYTPIADTCPLVVIETLACGVPIVTFNTGGIPELVTDKQGGFVFPQGDVDGLVCGVRALYDHRRLAGAMAQQARQTAEKRFSIEQTVRHYIDLYGQCIQRHRSPYRHIKYFDMNRVPAVIQTPDFLAAEKSKGQTGVGAHVGRTESTVPQTALPAPSKAPSSYRVSALVSTYNAEAFIDGCLRDLVNQTLYAKGQLEIVVINSGSQQNEDAVVQDFMRRYAHIRYIKTEQRESLYTAWNRGVRVASGRYLTNANTDDRHRRDALEVMADTLDACPHIGLVYGDQVVVNTPCEGFEDGCDGELARRPEFSRERLLFGCCVGSQPMWRTSLHDELGLFDETLTCASDWDFWLRIAKHYDFKRIDQCLGLYYNNQNGIEHGRKIHSLYERYIVGKRHGNPYISIISPYTHPSNPLVSIILPAYNAAAYIGDAIESVLIQNYFNIELIVINDGSTDATESIVKRYDDARIRCYSQPNGGASAARNHGIRRAKGAFVVMLDSDDFLSPDFVARHLAAAHVHPDADLIYSDDQLVDPDGRPVRVIERRSYKDPKELIGHMFCAGHPVVHFKSWIRRRVFDVIGTYDESLQIAEDYDMMRRFMIAKLTAVHLKGAYYHRRMTAGSLSQSRTREKAHMHFSVMDRFAATFDYTALFPDSDWHRIPSDQRPFYGELAVARVFMGVGQDYLKTGSSCFAEAAFEYAVRHLENCRAMSPEEASVLQLLATCRQFESRPAATPA